MNRPPLTIQLTFNKKLGVVRYVGRDGITYTGRILDDGIMIVIFDELDLPYIVFENSLAFIKFADEIEI